MDRLAKLSLSNRALIALITIFTMVFGVIAMSSLKQELIPSLEFPQITVITALPGASPEVVDKQVSEPLEGALTAVEGLESSSATSRTSLSTISLTFAYGTDLDRARGQVDRAISNARQLLPDDANPQSLAGSISDFPIVYLAVSSDQPLAELNSDLQRLTVPRLQKIEGVRTAEVTGGADRHVAILPDQAALAARGVSPAAIASALENSGALVPAGTVNEDKRTLSIQVGSPLDSLDKIAALPVESSAQTPDGAGPVTIGEVASVEIIDDDATSITRTNGVPTLAVSVTKTPAGDTVGISHQVLDLLPSLESELGNGARFTVIFDQAPFIEESISNLTTEGILGLGFAVLVILVFLLSVRSTLVTAVSIPLSLLATFIGLLALDYSLNILTLGALTIAIGRVVDDSIVVIENIKRHLGYGEDKRTAILTAVREVAGAITASTLTTVAVFAPIALVGGLAGELFRPFAITTSLALLASLLVSLTIVPVLAYWFLKSGTPVEDPAAYRAAVEGRESRTFLQRGYLPVLRTTQRHPVYTLLAGVLVLAGTVALTPLLQTNLLGDTGQNTFSVRQELPAGTSLATTSAAAEAVEAALTGTDGVKDAQVTMGTSSSGLAAFTSGGSAVANFTVITEPGVDQVALRETVRSELEALPDAGDITLGSTGGGFGTSNTVDIILSAGNAAELQPASDQVVAAMRGLPSAGEVSSNLSTSQPVVQVSIDRGKAVAAGLNEQQIAGLVASTISPLPAGTVRIGTDDFPVLIGEGIPISSVEQLSALPVPAGAGTVPLGQLATVEEVAVPTSISASGGERTAVVSVSPAGDNLGATITEVQNRLAELDLPPSVSASLSGAATQQNESFTQLGLALLAAIAIVYVIMVATFKSLLQPLILLVSVPFAATGAIVLLVISGVPLGLPSLVGMLMLVGIVVTNAIVLLDLINQYRHPRDGKPGLPVPEAIMKGARQRLRPILMTALATVFALTPMALGVTGEGGFISRPLAIVVIGGLVSSTVLTLILVPVLYRLVEGSREKRALAGSGAARE